MVVCDADETYASRLSEYFSEKDDFPFAIWYFYNLKQLQDFEKENEIEILLTSENICDQEMKFNQVKWTYFLTKERDKSNLLEKWIYKFQSAENILRRILSTYGEENDLPIQATATQTKLIGLYTPIGRCLQTSFTLLLGQILAKKSKVLYLNLEGCSGFKYLLNRDYSYNLSDLMYYITHAKDKFLYRMNGMVETVNGLDFIPPVRTYMDVTMIESEQWINLISEFLKISNYDYILLDLSDQLCGLFDILRKCSWIYTIEKDDGFAKAKIAQYEEMLSLANYEDILKKTKRCNLPIFRNIPYTIEKLPFSELAVFVKHIIEEDFNE